MKDLIILLIINGGFIAGYLLFLALGKHKKAKSAAKKSESGLIIFSLQNYWFSITDPLVNLLIKMSVTPNAITIFAVFISIAAGVLFAQGSWGAAGWVMITGGVFDLFDGRVARATNKVTKGGAYLDSVLDRYSDGAILAGLAWAFRDSWLLFFVILCFIGFYSVSYTKARAEASGVKCDVGTFQRPERIFSLGLSAIFSPILSYYMNWETPVLIYLVIIVLGLGTVATSVYRIVYTFKKL
jgi:CDP-diacylglycerol---glycerol-3-phosphate 3-phosphatidyltransferase